MTARKVVVPKATMARLPGELARRLKQRVPVRERSAFIQRLLEQALPRNESEGDPLYRAALEVERDDQLAAEMAEWDAAVGDGLETIMPPHA